MKLINKIDIGCKIIKAKLLNCKIPLAVSWSITNRCNLKCKYCGRWDSKMKELKTSEICSIINELKLAGSKILSFTGGEPLLRGDIREIIECAHNMGMFVNINTNGTLFLEKVSELSCLDSVRFSLDGPQEVNDHVRGEGVFKKVFEAIKAAKQRGMSVSIVTVLSKYNLNSIDYLIRIAKDLEVGVLFQPTTLTLLNSGVSNPHVPIAQEYKNTIDKLIKYKNPTILNTIKGLLYLKNWPEGKNILCYGRNISCRIETDGNVYRCGRRENNADSLSCLTSGIREAFDSLALAQCNDCWCALRLEANFIAALDLGSLFSAVLRE